MAGEHVMGAAAKAVHELLGDRVGFAIVAWVPGKGEECGAVAYACDPTHNTEAPGALATAAQVMRLGGHTAGQA